MEIEIEIEEARRRWDDLLDRVVGGARVILLRNGRPIGALIGPDDWQFLQRHRARRGLPTGPPN